MFTIEFYQRQQKKNPIFEYMKKDKSSHRKNKIMRKIHTKFL